MYFVFFRIFVFIRDSHNNNKFQSINFKIKWNLQL